MDYSDIDELIDTIRYEVNVEHNIEGAVKMVEDAPEELRNNKDFFRKLRMRIGYVFPDFLKCISEELSNDEEFILEMAQGEGINFSCASEQLRSNREFMERACKRIDPRYVAWFASPELKKSKDFILMALDNTDEGWLIVHADKQLLDDDDIRKVISKKYDGQRVINEMEKIKKEIEWKQQLQQKEAELSSLEAEEKTITETEALVDKQKGNREVKSRS